MPWPTAHQIDIWHKMRCQYRAPSVRLTDEPSEGADSQDPTRARWVQVAYTGHFKGHWQGEFEFTAKTFEQVVTNFRKHPGYKPGALTASAESIKAKEFDVVQYDFHHASEQPPTSGEIATIGAPAQGWVLELDVRKQSDGSAQLWAFSRFLEPAATYIADGKYRWTSVAIQFESVDPITKQPRGASITSIALTNQPFLQGLPAIAATANSVQAGNYYGGPFECIETPEDAFEAIRSCLGMPGTATVVEVAAEVAKLKSWTAPGATIPPGVEVAENVSIFRSILGMKVLSSTDDIFAELDNLFQKLNSTPATPPVTATMLEDTNMSTTNTPVAPDLNVLLSETYARKLGLKREDVTPSRLITLADQGADAMGELASLLEALGAKGIREALAKVAEAKGISDKFAALMPKYEAAQARIDEIDSAEADEDVGMAMASLGFQPNDTAKQNLRRTLTAARKADREGFRNEYGISKETKQLQTAEQQRQHLTTSIATTPATSGSSAHGPLGNLNLNAAGAVVSSTHQISRDAPNSGAVDISNYPGANPIQKAENYVLSTEPALAGPAMYSERHKKARALVNSGAVRVCVN